MQLIFENGHRTSVAKSRSTNETAATRAKVEDYSEISRIGMKVDSYNRINGLKFESSEFEEVLNVAWKDDGTW